MNEDLRNKERRGVRSRGKEKTICIQCASHVQIVTGLVLSCIPERSRIWVVCFFWGPNGDLFYQTWGLPCGWASRGIIPPKGRHLRDVKYKAVTQQLGTGSGDPATNWNFRLHVKFVPTWSVASAPGQISPLQQEAPGGHRKLHSHFLHATLPLRMAPVWLGQTAGINLPSDFAPFKMED